MAQQHQVIPPGFVRFQPSWYNKVRQRMKKPWFMVGYTILIKKESEAFLEILSPYQQITLCQKIYSLSGNPRPDKEIKHKKNTTDKYYLSERKTGFSITYEIISGTVLITSIVPDPDAFGEHKEVSGVFNVKRNLAGDWI